MEAVVQSVRKSFATKRTLDISWRKQQLKNLVKLVDENEAALVDALKKDLRKNSQETSIFELGLVRNSVAHTLLNIDEWAKPQKQTPPIQMRALYTPIIQKQPYGTVLIIGAWNYPYQLTLVPLIGAIAAGNNAVIKPSELAMHSAELLEKLFPKYLDPAFFKIVNGGIPETTDLLNQKFDYIFYTGNTAVGKIIMSAAAKNLTPVTLECGGKSPVFVDASADMEVTAKRLCWGRFANVGQTCVAPDYVLCTKETQERLLPFFKKVIKEFYGENPQESDSYGRVISQRHHKRISAMIDESKTVIGGQTDEKDLYISPTLMFNCTLDDKVMQEEIFGPVLPFVTVSNCQEAIDFVNKGSKPLALYVFSKNEKHYEEFQTQTSSGSMAHNEVIMQVGMECLPFGGVGDSGLGAYHGPWSFDTFSHSRAVLKASFFGDSLMATRYPPYSAQKQKLLEMMAGELNDFGLFKILFNPIVMMAVAVTFGYYLKGYTQ